ncbi:hypothetical protein l11_02650 [Neisseria weaveri LMG 5135]|nr:hypothetical protein l13_10380 [Neisseria weaveri ATCC 51223]EGV38818.1 hypothetical protein l11_02650 [Neisseria weaveri LMG 5135]
MPSENGVGFALPEKFKTASSFESETFELFDLNRVHNKA